MIEIEIHKRIMMYISFHQNNIIPYCFQTVLVQLFLHV